jgi:hypothetical protein
VQLNIDKAVKEKVLKKIVTDKCNIYKLRTGHTWQLLPRKQRQEYFKHGDDMINFKRASPVKKPPPEISPPVQPRKVSFWADGTLFGVN